MLQINWTKRQQIKYNYQLKRAKMTKKLKEPVKEEPTIAGSLGTLAPLLKNLDGEQIGSLVDKFTGNNYDDEPLGGGLTDGLINFVQDNPEVVQKFLGGINKDGEKEKGHKGQV